MLRGTTAHLRLAVALGVALAVGSVVTSAEAADVYRGDLWQKGGDRHSSMELGIAYRHHVAYSFSRVRIAKFPVRCKDGMREVGLNVDFPPVTDVPHPLIVGGLFKTRILDASGSTTILKGQVYPHRALGTLVFRSSDEEHGRCSTAGELRWRLFRA